jgi:c-di-GMP-binding flagellar brake protein YcgR
MWQERRKSPRLVLNLPVWYKVLGPEEVSKIFGSAYLSAISLDISPFGMAFMSSHNLPVFSELSLKFVVLGAQPTFYPNLSMPIEVSAKVCSCTPYGIDEYRVGVLFSKIEPQIQQKLASFIRESFPPPI